MTAKEKAFIHRTTCAREDEKVELIIQQGAINSWGLHAA